MYLSCFLLSIVQERIEWRNSEGFDIDRVRKIFKSKRNANERVEFK